MKKMKTTLATAAALAAASTQLFAQNTKEDTITFSLTEQGQASVSSSATANNAGTWFTQTTLKDGTVAGVGPTHYKTSSHKLTQVDILHSIGIVLHGSPSYYSAQAKLVLVQGELSGFFNITPDLAASAADTNIDTTPVEGFDGVFATDDGDADTSLAAGGNSLYAQLATGRHFAVVPSGSSTSGSATWGAYPPGHMQPWGQIYVKDPTKGTAECENVTYFFSLTVQECYDCFYMNSFISDANFSFVESKGNSGPPCCSLGSYMIGKGVDKYYLTLSFDNTENNPYLDPTKTDRYVGVTGLNPDANFGVNGGVDGISPDFLTFADSISSQLGRPSPYEMRFTLNGIVTYSWNLNLVNSGDVAPEFVGTATYPCTGYGYIGLICQLLTGSASFAERVVKTSTCCLGDDWYNSWYGIGAYADYNLKDDGQNFNAYLDYIDLPQATPLNVQASLTYHQGFDETYEPWYVESAEFLNGYYWSNSTE